MLADSLFPGLALPRLSCILYDWAHETFRLGHCCSGASLHQTLYRAAVDNVRMWEYCATLVVLALDLSTSLSYFSLFSQQLQPSRLTVRDTAMTLHARILTPQFLFETPNMSLVHAVACALVCVTTLSSTIVVIISSLTLVEFVRFWAR